MKNNNTQWKTECWTVDGRWYVDEPALTATWSTVRPSTPGGSWGSPPRRRLNGIDGMNGRRVAAVVTAGAPLVIRQELCRLRQ